MKIFISSPYKENKKIGNHEISHFDYSSCLKEGRNFFEIFKHGFLGSKLSSRLRHPEYLNKLYLNKDPDYFNYLDSFKEKYKNFDVIVMNPGLDLVHPEYLHKNFPNSLKCLHFVDDPHATYSYGFPFSWVFDCATYISPSYSENFSMKEILKLAGFKNTKWVPLSFSNNRNIYNSEEELIKINYSRINKIIYVGGFYSGKIERLLKIKNYFNKDFDIYGNFPLRGHALTAYAISKGILLPYKVKKISDEQKEDFYSKYAIGLNMHLSFPSIETGNARLYELAHRGVAQVVDTSRVSSVSSIFEPEKEILTYQTIRECIDQLERLKNNENLRNDLSINAYKKSKDKYNHENNLIELFNWFQKLKNDNLS